MLERIGSLSPRTQRLLLLLGCAVMFCLWLTWVPLTEVDEARFTSSTREMFETGNYLIPHFNYQPRYQKPIFYYWVQAASLCAFGVNEVAARLPSALAAIGLVLLVHAFLLRWLAPPGATRAARGAAFLGAAAVVSMPLIAMWARAAVTDITLTLFITGAVLALLQADLERRTLADTAASYRHARKWYLLAALAGALAVLTKGPIGLLIPLLVWLVYHLCRRTLRVEAQRVPWALALPTFALVTAPWYLATYFIDGPGFLTHFLVNENLQRFADVVKSHGIAHHYHAEGFFTYLPLVIFCFFPYSVFILRELLHPSARVAPAEPLASIRHFAWTWIGVVVGVFAFSSTQYPNYVQSIAGAVALLFALYALERLAHFHPQEPQHAVPGMVKIPYPPGRRQRWASSSEFGLLLFFGALWTAGPLWMLWRRQPPGKNLWLTPYPQPQTEIVMALLALAGITLLASIIVWKLRRRPAQLLGWAMGAWFALLAIILLGAVPLFYRSTFAHVAEMGRYLSLQPKGCTTLVYCTRFPEDLVFYGQRKINYYALDNPASLPEIKKRLAENKQAILITDQAGLPNLHGVAQLQVMKQFDRFVVTAPVKAGDRLASR